MKKQEIIQSKIFLIDSLQRNLSMWRLLGKKIVFTNGCFDIIHNGHVHYLSRAADLGNILIVGLNTDVSVKKLKGNSRPVQTEQARASVLSSLFFVNGVILFNEDTPINLIRLIKPNVLVKGSDYTEKEIVGADFVKSYGGEIKIIDFLKGFSTTDIINKVTV